VTPPKVSLNASSASLGKTTSGVPTVVYANTFPASASLTTSTSHLMPKRLLTSGIASANVTASSGGVTVTHAGYPATTYLSTFEAVANVTTDVSFLNHKWNVTPTTTTVTLNTGSATLMRQRSVTTPTATVMLTASIVHTTGWLSPMTRTATVNLSSSSVVIYHHRRGGAKHAHEHPSHGPVTIDRGTTKTTMKSPNMVERRMKKTRVGGAPWQQH
jgi:hypothetical protein